MVTWVVAETGAFWPPISFAVTLIVTYGALLFTPALHTKEQALIVTVFAVNVPELEAMLEGRLFPFTPMQAKVTGLLF